MSKSGAQRRLDHIQLQMAFVHLLSWVRAPLLGNESWALSLVSFVGTKESSSLEHAIERPSFHLAVKGTGSQKAGDGDAGKLEKGLHKGQMLFATTWIRSQRQNFPLSPPSTPRLCLLHKNDTQEWPICTRLVCFQNKQIKKEFIF